MNASLLFAIARLFAGISLVAIGGANAVVPEIHRQLVEHLHWMDDHTFVSLIGVAQVAPGPNVMIVSLIGWHLAGPLGLAIATAAMVLPSSCLAFAAGRLMQRHGENDLWRLAKRVLAPIAVGLILASGAVMARAADRTLLTIAVTLGMTVLVIRSRLNPLIGIAAAALLAMIAGRAGLALS
jgi:chromate transporter